MFSDGTPVGRVARTLEIVHSPETLGVNTKEGSKMRRGVLERDTQQGELEMAGAWSVLPGMADPNSLPPLLEASDWTALGDILSVVLSWGTSFVLG